MVLIGATIGNGAALALDMLPEKKTTPFSEEQKKEIVRQDCERIKSGFRNLQKIDSRTRVFLGKKYEKALSYYIIPLNASIVKSSVPATEVVKLQEDINYSKIEFGKDFIYYSQELEGLISASCDDTNGFLNRLQKTREKRKILGKRVDDIKIMLEKYKKAVESVKKDLAETNEVKVDFKMGEETK